MKAAALGTAILFALPASTDAQDARQAAQRAMALVRPALDGTVLAGIRLDFSEQAVLALLGEPHGRGTSSHGDAVLSYDIAPGVRLDVHVAGGAVNALGIVAPGRPDSATSPQTVRGIRLGMPVARVLERYGARADSRLWYAEEGIAFNVEAAAPTVTSILVFRRGTPAR
jgi:hypothetical protein